MFLAFFFGFLGGFDVGVSGFLNGYSVLESEFFPLLFRVICLGMVFEGPGSWLAASSLWCAELCPLYVDPDVDQ